MSCDLQQVEVEETVVKQPVAFILETPDDIKEVSWTELQGAEIGESWRAVTMAYADVYDEAEAIVVWRSDQKVVVWHTRESANGHNTEQREDRLVGYKL